MATPDEIAIRSQKNILVARDEYAAALRNLSAAKKTGGSPEDFSRALDRVIDAATKCFDTVEQSIIQSDLLGANLSELWARDLAGTSCNFLAGIPAYWTLVRRYKPEARPPSHAYATMQNVVLIYYPDQVSETRKRFEQAGLPIQGFIHPSKMNSRYSDYEKIGMVAIVCFFLLLLLAVAIWVRDPTDLAIFIFRVVMSLIAGAFGAIFIPGIFELSGEIGKWTVRAAGAAAFFAVVYLLNPPALVKNSVQERQHNTPPSVEQTSK